MNTSQRESENNEDAREARRAGTLRVRDLMSEEVVTFGFADELILADDLMRLGRIRHIPIVADDGRTLIGVLSQRDLFRSGMARALGIDDHGHDSVVKSLIVGDIMAKDVKTISPNDSIADAADIMLREKIGCLPVVADGSKELIGILTESDYVRHVGRK